MRRGVGEARDRAVALGDEPRVGAGHRRRSAGASSTASGGVLLEGGGGVAHVRAVDRRAVRPRRGRVGVADAHRGESSQPGVAGWRAKRAASSGASSDRTAASVAARSCVRQHGVGHQHERRAEPDPELGEQLRVSAGQLAGRLGGADLADQERPDQPEHRAAVARQLAQQRLGLDAGQPRQQRVLVASARARRRTAPPRGRAAVPRGRPRRSCGPGSGGTRGPRARRSAPRESRTGGRRSSARRRRARPRRPSSRGAARRRRPASSAASSTRSAVASSGTGAAAVERERQDPGGLGAHQAAAAAGGVARSRPRAERTAGDRPPAQAELRGAEGPQRPRQERGRGARGPPQRTGPAFVALAPARSPVAAAAAPAAWRSRRATPTRWAGRRSARHTGGGHRQRRRRAHHRSEHMVDLRGARQRVIDRLVEVAHEAGPVIGQVALANPDQPAEPPVLGVESARAGRRSSAGRSARGRRRRSGSASRAPRRRPRAPARSTACRPRGCR